jgi:hypothetical protein
MLNVLVVERPEVREVLLEWCRLRGIGMVVNGYEIAIADPADEVRFQEELRKLRSTVRALYTYSSRGWITSESDDVSPLTIPWSESWTATVYGIMLNAFHQRWPELAHVRFE